MNRVGMGAKDETCGDGSDSFPGGVAANLLVNGEAFGPRRMELESHVRYLVCFL